MPRPNEGFWDLPQLGGDAARTPPDPLPLAPVGFSKIVQTGALVIRAQPPVRHLILILCAAGGYCKVVQPKHID